MRDLLVGSAVAVGTWLCLAVGLGNVRLQRSVAVGPLTLLERPTTMVLVAVLAFGTAFSLARVTPSVWPSRVTAAVLGADLVGAVVLAPIAIGELRPMDAPVVLVVLAALGVQPAASWVGATAARRWRSGWAPPAT